MLIHNGMASVKPTHKTYTGITYVEKYKLTSLLEYYYNLEHDRQCTYNVIFRRVRVTLISVEKQ